MPLNYRRAVKLIREHGGRFLVHGKKHDEFLMPWGAKIEVPRHKGDFTPGVEDDIKKRIAGKR